jgi:peptide/nickel transport system substrate-binding protein
MSMRGATPRSPRRLRAERGHGVALLAAALLLAAGCRRAPERALEVGLATGLAHLDPHLENTVSALEQLANVFEPLVTLDEEMRARPCLASSWSTPGPTTWVFRLRPGVVFDDGRPLDAGDVVFSLSRPRRDPRLTVASFLSSVKDVSARSADTVVVTTRDPDALLLANLSFVAIVPDGATTGTLETSPVGTGPWRVEAWEPGRELRLRRNERYWGERPVFSAARVAFSVSAEEAAAGISSGRWDVLRSSAPRVEQLVGGGKAWANVRFPNVFLRHLGFDVSREETPFCPGIPNPFRRREVREAISLALDRAAIARRADVDAVPASQLVPPAIFGFDPAAPPLPHDAARARALLAEAGYPDGFDVTLHRSGFGGAAAEVQAQLAAIGIRVTVEQLPGPAFFSALDGRELSFWLAADGCPTGDALEILVSSFHSPSAAGAGVDNYGGYVNSALDREIEAARRELEPDRRLPLLRAALRTALADGSWVPLYFARDSLVVRRTIDFRPRADGLLRLADLRRAR